MPKKTLKFIFILACVIVLVADITTFFNIQNQLTTFQKTYLPRYAAIEIYHAAINFQLLVSISMVISILFWFKQKIKYALIVFVLGILCAYIFRNTIELHTLFYRWV